MSPNADRLLQLMKQRVDALLAADEKLQQFLTWLKQKADSVKVCHKPAAIRAFYLDLTGSFYLGLFPTAELAHSIDHAVDSVYKHLSSELALDYALTSADFHASELVALATRYSNFDSKLELTAYNVFSLHSNLELAFSQATTLKPELLTLLQQLKNRLPISEEEKFETWWRVHAEKWWKTKGQTWHEEIRVLMVDYRNIGFNWEFQQDNQHLDALWYDYYRVNQLLVDCLNSDCYVISREVRQEIEDTLLLPIAEVEQQKAKSV